MINHTKIKQRLDFIDYAKGIAMLMMLLGHSVPHSESIHIAIFSFHMPFFFIVCGYLAYLKYPYGLAFGESGYYFLRRERNILEPYIVFGFMLICLYCFFDTLSLHTLSEKTISRIVSWITLGGGGFYVVFACLLFF